MYSCIKNNTRENILINGEWEGTIIMIPYPHHFSVVTSIPWLKNRKYLRAPQNYLPLVDVPFELVQSRDGFMIHLHDEAGSSGEDSGCDVTLRQQEHSYCPSQFSGFWTWWEGHADLEKALSKHSEWLWLILNSQSYPFNFFDIAFLFFHLSSLSLKLWKHMICAPLFMFGMRGLQFAIWKVEKKQLSVSFYWLCAATSLIWSTYNIL